MLVKRLAVIALSMMLLIVPITLGSCSEMFPESPDIAPHLIAEPEQNPVRPIDSREIEALSAFTSPLTDAQYRARIDELYRIVAEDGKKPQFATADPVKPVYDAAIELLDRYILNSWHTPSGEVNIVHAIHDYLVVSVEYDNELYESYRHGKDVTDNPAFHIDGVLLNNLAVCDGLSKAFAFLCAVEGVEATRVTGSYISVPHAWNKVKVSGVWYNVDVTADSAYYTVDGNDSRRQLSHGYFLLSDYTMKSFRPKLHVFESTVMCNLDYDYFGKSEFTIGNKTFSSVVTSQSELNAIFGAISSSNRAVGKIELKLDFPGKININDSDMYVSEINAAYTRLPDADFTTASQRPYFQAPGGVYLFLIYK